MRFSFGKRSMLGLVAGAIMTIGVAAPAFAGPVTSNSQTVSVTANNQPALTFTTVSGPAVPFGPLDPANACATPTNGSSFKVESNRSYTGTVRAAASVATGTSDIPVTQLFWSHTTQGPATCAAPSVAFATTASLWTSGLATNGTTISDTFALKVFYTNTDGNVDMTLTYLVSQGS